MTSDISQWVVLIVDDEPDNVSVARKVLTFNGATVHVAANGVEGLAMLEQLFPTFVLLDLSMPEMDGWEMFARMRASDRLRSVPVIALTAHAMSGDRARVLDAGFDGYISKPFRIASLLDDITESLKNVAK